MEQTTAFDVGTIGFSEQEIGKIKKFFHVTDSRERSYQLKDIGHNDAVDMVMVNLDSHSGVENNEFLNQHPGIPVITVSRNTAAGNTDGYHIKGMLLATKVIRVLDTVVIPEQKAGSAHCRRTDRSSATVTSTPTDRQTKNILSTATHQAHPTENCFKVLVVDDSAMMQQSLALELGNAPHQIETDFANDGETALVKIQQSKYDFIFLDVMMPGIDGYETCSEIRKIEAMRRTPVIMLSAKTSPLDEVKGIMAGCTNYLTKPIDSNDFQNMLQRILNWLRDFRQAELIKETYQ